MCERARLGGFLLGMFACFSSPCAWGQDSSAEPRPKVCLAEVNNRTATSLMTERLTERLARNLSGRKRKAVAMQSRTTDARDLRPTLENSEESKRMECSYLILTQVTDPRSHPTDFALPQISLGGRRPNADSSDHTDAAVRDTLEINFSLYRMGSPKPILDTRILDEPSGNVSDSLMEGMEREANRIDHELKKKGQ